MKKITRARRRASVCAVLVTALLPLAGAHNARGASRLGHAQPGWRYSTADNAFRSLDHIDPDDFGRPLRSSVVNDTILLGSWDFDAGCHDQGWTPVDRTEQTGAYFHVDDFAGLGGGDYGRLVAIEGIQSLWCGARPAPADAELCHYAQLPGYGNNWVQHFGTVDCLDVTGDVAVDYRIAWDSEPDYDFTTLQYDACDNNWVDLEGGLGVWEGVGSGSYSSTIPDSLHSGTVRLRFRFTSDVIWSDEDALWDTDGAVIVDSLTVRDGSGVVLATEDFEGEAVGATATASGNWSAGIESGYGTFAALVPGYNSVQEVPCRSNITCVWAFYSGSTADYSCGGHPEQTVVPYGNESGQYIWNEVWSPWIPITGTGESLELAFDVYNDLPIDPLVFYVWHIRTRDESGCPGAWRDRERVYPGANLPVRWIREIESIGDLVQPGAAEIQVALGVRDMCSVWCGSIGTGTCHSNAPLFDNVEVRRIDTVGPQWNVRDVDLFQDTFAADGTTTGTARIDAAIDIGVNQLYNPSPIHPGDSLAVTTMDLEYGLATDPYTGSGPAVYAYVSIWNGIDPYPGSAITDSPRWPVVDSLAYSGRTWYCVRMDTAYGEDGPEPDRFCVDLNDDLFVPGDTVFFFFAATSAPPGGQTTYWSPFTGTTPSMTDALDDPDECTILPAGGWHNGGEILYVDGFNGLGAEPFFDTSFAANGYLDQVDRYDIRGPRERAGNHPGARVVSVSQQLLPCYRAIVWNTGDVVRGNLGDGYSVIGNDKSDDVGMLLDFLDGLQESGGVFLSGDNIAEEWENLDGRAWNLRSNYIHHLLVDGDHRHQGLRSWPTVIGEPGSPHDHTMGPDSTYAFSLCPDYTNFDVLAPDAASSQWLRYDGASPGSNGAGITQLTTNPNGETVGVALWGFSFHDIRDDRAVGWMDRFHLMRETLIFTCGIILPTVTAATSPPGVNSLSQNVPNPFNPTTAIEFTVRERAPVTLRVYNVRGQLVRTLVDDVRLPGIVHRIAWDGHNNAGQQVASGVYFYRLATKGFTKTKKMVLLK